MKSHTTGNGNIHHMVELSIPVLSLSGIESYTDGNKRGG